MNNSVYEKKKRKNIGVKNIEYIKMSSWNDKEATRLFQELKFYNTFIEEPKITGIKNIDLLHELPFYDELNIIQISKAFGWYVRTYKVEITDSKHPLAQLEASKSNIKDLLKDLLGEIKGFKYQITVKASSRKHKRNRGIDPAPVDFNYTTKTMINFKYGLKKYFQEVLYKIDNWINGGSGWVIESVDAEYVNIAVYSSLSGSAYIELSCNLKNSMNERFD